MNIFYVYMKVWYMCECGVHVLCVHHMDVLCSQTLGKVIRFLVYHFLPYSLKTGSLAETETGLVTNKPCPCVQQHWDYRYAQLCPAMPSYAHLFTQVLRIQTWVLMFV